MITIRTVTACVCGLVLAVSAFAADRGARAIDTVGVELGQFDDGDRLAAYIRGEVALADRDPSWSVLVGGAWGEISPDASPDVTYWEAGLGIKYYLTVLTSLSLFGSYGQYTDLPGDAEILTGSARFEQRLAPSERNVSPYLAADFAYRSCDQAYEPGPADDYEEFVLAGLAGCDFMLTDTLALVIEGGYAVAEEVSGEFETPDTVVLRAGFKGYWD